MKNLLTYIPEPFENLEFESEVFEYEPPVGEMDMGLEEDEVRRRGRRARRASSWRRPYKHSPSGGRLRLPRRPKHHHPHRPPHRPHWPQLPLASSSGGAFAAPQTVSSLWCRQEGSERIRWMQDCLNWILDLRLIVDGIMNRETRSALRTFQRKYELPVTGFIGPDTEGKLKAACQQAAMEPELLEGEWEIEHSADCLCPVCSGRGAGELAFEAEQFMKHF